MKTLIKITKSELIQLLKNWNYGSQPVSIQYITEPKLTKEGKQLYGSVTKIANVGGLIGYCYENSVNNQLERENKERDFISKPLWNGKGKRLSTALSTHVEKGNFYLTYKAQQTFRSYYFDKDMKIIPNNIIKPFFPVNDPTKYQGTEQAIYHREIDINNIKRFKLKKVTYEII